jgi:hypothetical protein
MSKTNEKATVLGNFYIVANRYIGKFKIGGNQKLQKIIGEDLYFKKANDWWFSHKIGKMTTTEIGRLTKKIENA